MQSPAETRRPASAPEASLRPGSGAPRLRWSKQSRLALAVTALFALAQLASLVHLAAVPHTLDAHTGEIVGCQADHHHGEPAPDTDTGPSDSDDGTQECAFHAFLNLASTHSAAITVQAPPPPTHAPSVARPHQTALRGEALYLLAPSHSPPASSIG